MSKQAKLKKQTKTKRLGEAFIKRKSPKKLTSGGLSVTGRDKSSGALVLSREFESVKAETESSGMVMTPPTHSETIEYANVLSHAVDTFGSRTNANAWLNRPNRMFANKTPLQILTEDPEAVEEELVRIDHGMFARSST